MDNTEYKWLVEIRVKDWHKHAGMVFDYVEVMARKGYCVGNEFARLKGFSEIERCYQFRPSFRARLDSLGLAMHDLCAPDAVIID